MMISPEIIGTIAAILTTASFIPQAIKTIRTRQTRAISLKMYVMLNSGIFCWLVYGILLTNYPLILANGISLIFTATILYYKLREPKPHEILPEVIATMVDDNQSIDSAT